MASGTFSVTTNNSYISGHISWSESNENIANNTTDVTATMYLSRTNTYGPSYGTDTFYVTINGTKISNTLSYSISYNSNTVMVSGKVPVTHNADGSKSITIGWGGGGGSGGVFTVNSGSGTANLMTIPRASTVSSNVSWTAGTQNLPITLNVASSSFHHTLNLYVQHTGDGNYDLVGQRTNIGSSGTTWTFTQTEITQIYTTNNMYENRPVILRVYTYDSSNNLIGSYQDKAGTVYAIPTATATLGSSNVFDIGASIPYALNNYTAGSSGGFTYDLIMTFGSFSKTWSGLTVQTGTLSLSSAEVQSVFAQIPNANSGSGTIQTRTKYNGVYTEDGLPTSDKTTFTANVTNSNPIFNGTFTYADTNSTTTGLTGNNQQIIQNQSIVNVTLSSTQFATPVNGSSITQYVCTVSNKSVAVSNPTGDIVFAIGIVDAGSNTNISIKAIDSRGNSTTQSMTMTVIPWTAPKISATATRANGFNASTTLTLSGTFSSNVPTNTITSVQYTYKAKSDVNPYPAATSFTSLSITNSSYSTANAIISLDNTASWYVEILVADKLATAITVLSVSTGVPLAFFDKDLKSTSFGQFPQNPNSFEVANPIYESGVSLMDKYAPAGVINMFGGTTAPNGWLLCQGQAISRTTYARLYNIIGTIYGIGDGSTTFNLPNLQSRVPVGYNSGDSNFNSLGKTGGESTHTLTIDEIPVHKHQEWIHGTGGTTSGYGVANLANNLGGTAASIDYTGNAGGGLAHNNLQPYITLNFIIKI